MDDAYLEGLKVLLAIVLIIIIIISIKAYLAGNIIKAFYLLLLVIALGK